jgi:ankyrin repeat protein
LFHTKVLDDAVSKDIFEGWQVRKYYGAETLWHDYLVFRCRNETDESVGRFVEIRNVANALLEHSKAQEGDLTLDFDAILDGLCWLSLERGTKYPGCRQGWDSSTRSKMSDPDLNLLSAAAYFGCVPIVRHLLGQGYDPVQTNDLFPSPMYLAAWTGQVEILELMQEHLPECEIIEPGNKWAGHRLKIAPESLRGAATRGDINMMRLAIYPPSRIIPPSGNNAGEGGNEGTVPNSILILGQKPGSIPLGTIPYSCISNARNVTKSPEIYQYLHRFLAEGDAKSDLEKENYYLALKAAAGDIVMVRHLLDFGARPIDMGGRQGPALTHAIRGWHEDVVDLLLERGADPNERGTYRLGTPLTAAAKAGSMVMLRKLLDAGAEITKADAHTLRHAIRMEHTAMVELLLRMGAGSEQVRRRYLDEARDAGLESMVNLLMSWGVRGMGE